MKPECPVKEGTNFQVGEVQVCITIGKFLGLLFFHNHTIMYKFC